MNAELSRLLAQAFQSPYFRYICSLESNITREKIINEANTAYTYDKLSQETKEILDKSLQSKDVGTQLFPKAAGFYPSNQMIAIFLKIERDTDG